jgi:hypothetical protein
MLAIVLEWRLARCGEVALELKRRPAEQRADGERVVEQRRLVGLHDTLAAREAVDCGTELVAVGVQVPTVGPLRGGVGSLATRRDSVRILSSTNWKRHVTL